MKKETFKAGDVVVPSRCWIANTTQPRRLPKEGVVERILSNDNLFVKSAGTKRTRPWRSDWWTKKDVA